MASSTAPYPPLTTVFTPAAMCETLPWTFPISTGTRTAYMWRTYAQNYPQCFPSGMWSDRNTFSPGVCPSGKTTAGVELSAGVTTVLCCPSNYISFWDGCASLLTTSVEAWFFDSSEKYISSTTGTAVDSGIYVLYRDTDTSLFPSDYVLAAESASYYTVGYDSPYPTGAIPLETSSSNSSGNGTSNSDSGSGGGLSNGATIGLGVGIPVAVIVLLLTLYCWRRRRRSSVPLSMQSPNPKLQRINRPEKTGPSAGTNGAHAQDEVKNPEHNVYAMQNNGADDEDDGRRTGRPDSTVYGYGNGAPQTVHGYSTGAPDDYGQRSGASPYS